MLKDKKKSVTTRDLPIGKKPDPNFKPYSGPSITTANFQKFIRPVVAAEKTTEVPVVGLEKLKADGICQGITKAGNRCKRSVLEGTLYCPAHQLKPGDIISGE